MPKRQIIRRKQDVSKYVNIGNGQKFEQKIFLYFLPVPERWQ